MKRMIGFFLALSLLLTGCYELKEISPVQSPESTVIISQPFAVESSASLAGDISSDGDSAAGSSTVHNSSAAGDKPSEAAVSSGKSAGSAQSKTPSLQVSSSAQPAARSSTPASTAASSQKASATTTAIGNIPDTASQNGVSVKINRMESVGNDNVVYFNLAYTDGTYFPAMCFVDFSKFTLSDENGNVLHTGAGNNSYYEKFGSKCKNMTEQGVPSVEGSIMFTNLEIVKAKYLVLKLENMIVYTMKNTEPAFNITKYVADHPELIKTMPTLELERIVNGRNIYKEPVMQRGNLGIRLGDGIRYSLDNLYINNKLLVYRINFDTEPYMNEPVSIVVKCGDKVLSTSQTGVYEVDAKRYACFVYLLDDSASINDVMISMVVYRSMLKNVDSVWQCKTKIN